MKILVKTFGCSLNQSDSELMAGLLKDAGHELINSFSSSVKESDPEDVDLIIINTCSVKNLAEKKFFREFKKWQSKGIKIIVAGCIPQAEPDLLNNELKDVSVIGTRQLVHIVDILNDTMAGKIIHNISNDYNERLNLPKLRKSGIIEILPISEGCLSNCTYCKTKFARGDLHSYPKEKIIQQFISALKDGCKEFWITSQDNGCYGFDIYRKEKYFLPQLLNDLLSVEGDFRIRLGMANPDHIDRIKKDLIETFKHPKIFKFLHIPVQSGNNRVLKSMKRYYLIEEFESIIAEFRKAIPNIVISTDVIIGFPEETDEEFSDSINLVVKNNINLVNFSRFWLRKGTEAEKLPQLYGGISKDRSELFKRKMDELMISDNASWVGKRCIVIIDEIGKNGKFIGRNDYYKQVLIIDADRKDAITRDQHDLKLGDFVEVKIVSSSVFHLIGEVVYELVSVSK